MKDHVGTMGAVSVRSYKTPAVGRVYLRGFWTTRNSVMTWFSLPEAEFYSASPDETNTLHFTKPSSREIRE